MYAIEPIDDDHIIYIKHTNDRRVIESCEDYFIVKDTYVVETKYGKADSNSEEK